MAEPRQLHISAIDEAPVAKEATFFDAGDAKSVKDRIKDSKQLGASKAETLRWIMSEEKGRKFFHELLTITHILRNPYRSNALSMAFECGEMNIGQQVFIDLQAACPDLYLQMMEESKEKKYG